MPKAHNPNKPLKREGRQISFWLVPSKESVETDHDFLLRWVEWWNKQRLDISSKARNGLLLLAYIEAGDVDGFLSKIPASFYSALAQRINPAVVPSPTPAPAYTPYPSTPIEKGGIEAINIDVDEFISNADDDLDALFE